MRCLNLGAGKDIRRGIDEWVNLDKVSLPGIDVVHDIANPLPFPDNSFDFVYCSHILEHLGFDKKVYIFEELWRITKPQGRIEILLPNFSHRNAYFDPTHLSVWEIHNVDYFVPGHWANYYGRCRWNIIKSEIRGNEQEEIHWILEVVK
jgi:predicted SAM-dependent methyltransferase